MSLEAYSPHEHRPLAAYGVMTGAFGAAFGGAMTALQAGGRDLPRIGAGDVVLLALATQKLSRLVSKDRVTSFLRAPFVRYREPAGHGEVEEEPRGRGLQLAMGELLVCPYCISQWVAAALAIGLVGAPRPTRVLLGMWSAQALADAAQLGYSAAAERP